MIDKKAFYSLSYGLYIITTEADGFAAGCVCNTFQQVTSDPMQVSVALNKEITFRTVFRYRHIYPMAIAAAAAGKIDLKDVVTNRFTLDQIQEAMEKSVSDKVNIVKAVIEVAGE